VLEPAAEALLAGHDEVSIATTATEVAREESLGAFWALVIGGLIFIVAGWMLPWFVPLTANGVGESPANAIHHFTGVGTVFIWLLSAAMVLLIAGVGYDVYAMVTGRDQPFRYSYIRAGIALAGVASVLVIWVLIAQEQEEALFGQISLSKFAATDNAVWISLTGFAVLAFVYGLHRWVQEHGPIAFAIVAFVFGGMFPLIFNKADDFIQWGASAAAIYTLLALGLNVVVGFAGLLDLGYAAFFAIGAYTAGSFNSAARHGDVLNLPFWVILFLAVAVAALFGALLGAPTLRLRGDYLAIVTLGFGEIVPDAANNDLFHQTGGPNGITGIGHPSIGPLNFGITYKYYFWALLVIIGVVIILLRNLQRSRLGRAWVAIREDEIAAAATGINTVSTKLLAFAIGASVSGLAGAFYGAELGIVSPDDFGFAVSVTALTTVVLGGIGNNTGAAVGGLLVSFIIFWILPHLQEWGTTFGTTTGITSLGTIDYPKYTYIVYGLILVVIMLLRPGGLLPSRARKVELQAGAESEPLAAVRGTA
jgi:branched-chain amino acid transport system permease protein